MRAVPVTPRHEGLSRNNELPQKICTYGRQSFYNIKQCTSANHFITQGNYTATCFDYRLVILRPIFSIVSQYAMHTLGSHRVYIHGIHQIK